MSALGPIHLPIQRVPGALSLRVKRQRREADNSHPSSVDVKKGEAIFILIANRFLTSDSGTTIGHNTQIHISHKYTYHTNNRTCLNKTQHTKLHKQ
jgi:hypothetical protein